MSIRTLTSALGAATLAAALAVAGQSLAAPSELTIGVLPELTGPLSESGPAFEKASRLAVDVANKAAAKAGLPMTVKIAVADSQGDPQAALSAARTLIDKGASCLVGPATTPELISILNGITMQRKITLWPTATSTRLRKVNDDHTIFRTVPADDPAGQGACHGDRRSTSAQGKKVSVAYRNEPYGDALAKSFNDNWQAAGGSVTTRCPSIRNRRASNPKPDRSSRAIRTPMS